MSTGTQKYEGHAEPETRHSALDEFARDERRPAILLLAALIIAAIFFALGIIFDRWTSNRNSRSNQSSTYTQSPSPLSATTKPQD